MTRQPELTCLTYCALPYAGTGWPRTCVNILSQFPSHSIQPIMALPRLRAEGPPSIHFDPCLRFPLSRLPWNVVRPRAERQLASAFKAQLDRSDPGSTIAYLWPGTPPEIVEHARRRGILTVREMINCCMATAKPILDRAYRRAGLPPEHYISDSAAEGEKAELALYDYVTAPGQCVEDSLREAGVDRWRIVLTSFGWERARFVGQAALESDTAFRALFVGTACVRKGIPELIEAWVRSDLQGELLIVGDVEPCLAKRLDDAAENHSIRRVPFTSNLGGLYRSSDVFVFPSLEEGGPQVILEAGGCGLPVITTPMGTSRLVENGRNGLVVRPGDVDELAAALVTLATNSALRRRFAKQIAIDAEAFAYDRVSASRARIMTALLEANRIDPNMEIASLAQNE